MDPLSLLVSGVRSKRIAGAIASLVLGALGVGWYVVTRLREGDSDARRVLCLIALLCVFAGWSTLARLRNGDVV